MNNVFAQQTHVDERRVHPGLGAAGRVAGPGARSGRLLLGFVINHFQGAKQLALFNYLFLINLSTYKNITGNLKKV